nr:BRCT domain-containing protein At4g02110-like isoform X4 [Lolium perenne]XP_051213511.1 BRCT domain-containing protein At4g02110-like isoform X5 [Lolium perenne]
MSPHDGGGDDGRDGDGDGLLFAGVRFALAGFDPVTESQYRADMVERGGADAGGHGEAGCTHVVVFGLVYDDPVCVAARGGGKKVVTELWVDDTLDTGAMADADRVIYRPVRDLNGIPGSQSLNICLTGYQKDGREDIMKMVSLMGAQFSKPLKADTVTHLICYKFEGEKYELAKKVNINLVNHMWLEACLKAWEILPIDNYRKSGWEQEMMEAQVEDSADEADDAARVLSRSRGIARRSPITEIRMGAHVDPDVYAPIRDPTVSLGNAEVAAGRHLNTPKQVSKTEDVCERSLDARADIQSTHNTNFVTNSADTEARNSVHSRINPCSNEKAPGDHITRDEEKNGDKGPVDARASALPTINTNGATECADHFVHQPTVIPAIPVVDTDNIADGSDLFIANSVQLPTPSAESLLEKPLQSSDMTGKVDHKDNGPVANLVDGVGQSNSEGNIALVKANSISAGNSASKNSPILGYSRRRSRKSVSPGTNLSSAHQTASLHSYERNSPNVKISISPSTKSNHTISKLADAKSPRDEATQCVDRSDIVLAQTNSGLSSASPLPLNGGTDSAAGTANIPLPSREIASEAATVSDPAKKSTGSQPIKVNGDLSVDVTVNHTVSQMSGSSKKKVLSYRRASLKLAKSPEVVEKLPEIFAKEAIIESLAKAKELAQHELAAEKACAISPSLDSEFEKGSSSFSNQNWNIEMSNAPQVNSIEVAEVSHATMEAGAMKLSSSRVKSTGAKRSRNATNGAHTSFASRKREIATYKSRHNIGAVISHENIEADKEKDCTSPNAAECTTSFPEEILSSKARSVDTSSLNANSEVNGVPGASKLEFANLISQGNINKKPRRLPSSANDNHYQRGSSEKVSSSIERSAVANVSQPADMKMAMAGAPTADKADTVSLKSSFSEAAPQADTEKKMLSYRRASLKLAKSREVEKLPEIFAKDAIIESLDKAKELAQHEVAPEKTCAISPSMDSEFEKASSSFSLQNRNIEASNAPQVNGIEVAATGSHHDKEVSHATMEADSRKVWTSRVKSTSAKRSRNATNGAHTSFARRKRESATSESKHDIGAVISHENVEAEPEKDCTSLTAAECTTSFPEEIRSSKARSVAASSLNANSEMNGVPGASKLEFANLISQGNINKKHRKLPSSANDNNYQKGSSEKVSSAIEKSAVANVSQPADMRMVMVCAATADKADTVSLKSSFSEAVPQADTEKLSSSASADNHEPCAPDRVPNKRVRKAVAKRKISGALQYIPSEAEVLTIKQAAESSTNAGKAMGKDLQSANEDGMANQAASFCKDSFEDGSEDMQNIRPMTSKKNKVVDAMDDSVGQNKENIPVNVNLSPKSKYGNKCVGSKCMKKPVQKGKGVLCERSMTGGNDCGTLSLSEPTWFILGGHRLLRKDYMSILRRLKGRVCRSSHHWSFQATHLIAPELRRTEKFFAAAAAGRWILKADYLSACNEAGKFLEEESFEWHGDGLNSGDTISLDAPRKWRHLRERTGHGAFHGMKIIIYGECISPSLDTMKRALRAGDGTILATSPPYTRLLKHDVSFAVVSAGMASTDAWVQEFMNHNIPCVSADYLVEYVCKPGHPLSKHVLFNMHELAEKSLQKIQNSQRDELGASTGEAGEGGDTEPSCSACGSSNREGALMLICSGSQGNKASCGAGMHVDCLNLSPEAAAPDGDWLCPKCDDDGQVKPPPKKAEKGARKLKPKAQMSSCC